MPTPRGSDDGLQLLMNNMSEQMKRISEQQEQLRTYLLSQLDEMRQTIIRRDEYRDNLEAVRRDVAGIASKVGQDVAVISAKVDRLEDSLTDKIEKMGEKTKEQQDENYKSLIKVQAIALGFIVTTIVSIAIKVFLH